MQESLPISLVSVLPFCRTQNFIQRASAFLLHSNFSVLKRLSCAPYKLSRRSPDTSNNWVKGTELVRHRGDLKCSKTSQACLMLHKRLKNPMIPLNPASEIIPTQVLKLLHMDLIWGVPARRTSKRLRKAHPRASTEQQPSLSTIVSAAQDWEVKKNPPGI